jgi:hypothetical protein
MVIFFLLSAACAAAAQQTDCGECKYPYPPNPPCGKQCRDLFVVPKLIYGTEAELRAFFALDKEAAQKIITLNAELKTSQKLPSIELYKQVLSEDEFKVFIERLENLNEKNTLYLELPPENKTKLGVRSKLSEHYMDIDRDKIEFEQKLDRRQDSFEKDIQKDIQKNVQTQVTVKQPDN